MNNKATYLTSQALNTKNLTPKGFEPAKLRGDGSKIWNVIYRFRSLSSFKLTNEFIAFHAGCTTRTVQRWTSRWEGMGILTKTQAHLYAHNQYRLNISKHQSFQIWFSGLPPEEQTLWNTHGITIRKTPKASLHAETVVLSYSSSQLVNLLTIPTHPVRASRTPHIHAREGLVTNRHTFKKSVNFGFLSKKEETMEAYNPITQVIRDIKSIKLTKWGQIRLMAYPDKAISFAEQQMQYANMTSVKDPFKLFAFHCSDYCKKNDEKPNWEVVSQLEAAYKAPEDRTFVLFSAKLSPVNQPSKNFQQKGGHRSPPTKVESPSVLRDKLEHWQEVLAQSAIGSRERAEARAQICICKQLLGDQYQPVGDKVVPTVVVSPSASSEGEASVLHEGGEDHVVSDEVCDPFGAHTVEEGWDEYTPEIVLRSAENGQISMWDRVSTPAWRGT